MEIRDLHCFLAVAEAAGFRRASENLDIAQSAVSRRVRGLEDELGVSLFERRRGGVCLTGAGRRFLEDVRLTLDHLEVAASSARAAGAAREGSLTIGVVASISSGFLNLLLREYRAAYPRVAVQILEDDPETHIAGVLARTLDLAVLTGVQQQRGCDAEQLWSEPILAAVAAPSVGATCDRLCLKDLADETFIVSRSAPGPEIHDFIVQRLARLGFRPRIEHHRVSREGLMSMVGLGFGVSLISGAEAGVSYPNVAFVPLDGEALPFSAIWSPENDNPALRRLLSAARVQARKAGGAALSRTPDPSP